MSLPHHTTLCQSPLTRSGQSGGDGCGKRNRHFGFFRREFEREAATVCPGLTRSRATLHNVATELLTEQPVKTHPILNHNPHVIANEQEDFISGGEVEAIQHKAQRLLVSDRTIVGVAFDFLLVFGRIPLQFVFEELLPG